VSTLDSASTLTNVLDAYRNNASYEEDGSDTKAAAFITACRFLIDMRADTVRHGGEWVGFTEDRYAAQIKQAQRWRTLNQATGRTRFADFETFRS
jgi:hypothetical protein